MCKICLTLKLKALCSTEIIFSVETNFVLNYYFRCKWPIQQKKSCKEFVRIWEELGTWFSKIIILCYALNFEVRPILYIIFFVAINLYNKECPVTKSPKLQNEEVINFKKLEPWILKLDKFYTKPVLLQLIVQLKNPGAKFVLIE